MTAVELLQQAGEERLWFDRNAGRAQFEEDADAIASVGADVEDERAAADELCVEAVVAACAAGLTVVD